MWLDRVELGVMWLDSVELGVMWLDRVELVSCGCKSGSLQML